MSGLRLLCGGKDRGLPPVARVDIFLGVLVVAVALALVGALALGLVMALLALLRLLGAPSGAMVALTLAGGVGAAAIVRARAVR
jgi:hypothetical protein